MNTVVPLIRAGAILPFLRWLDDNGRWSDDHLRLSRLSNYDVHDAGSVVPMIGVIAFVHEIVRREGPDIGCRVVSAASLNDIGGIGAVVKRCRTLRQGLTALAVAASRHNTHEHFSVMPDGDGIIFREFHSLDIDQVVLHVIHQYVASLVWQMCRLSGRPEPLLGDIAIVPHPTLGLSHLVKWLGVRVRPATTNALEVRISGGVVDCPITPEAVIIPHDWENLRDQGGLRQSVCYLLKHLLPEGEPDIGEVARLCNLSVRNLQRILATEGTSLSELIDHVRRQVAVDLLASGKSSVTEVSSAVGYGSPSNLTRAVKRWTGKTPTELMTGRH